MKESRTQVYVTRDEHTDDGLVPVGIEVQGWEDFFALVHSVDVPKDFMAGRPMNVVTPQRGVFDL
jgi:antitoxin VapB